jgi:hypothetical protein
MNNYQQDKNQLTKKERRLLKRKRQAQERKQLYRKQRMKKAGTWLLVSLGTIGVIAAFVLFTSSQPVLPPMSPQNHIEESPPSHIVTEPLDNRIFRHMLEHADGAGPPGVMISYNCDDFDCPSDLIDDLAGFVEEYPENVFVAPYRGMSEMLVLTKSGKQKALEAYDEDVIRDFIEE